MTAWGRDLLEKLKGVERHKRNWTVCVSQKHFNTVKESVYGSSTKFSQTEFVLFTLIIGRRCTVSVFMVKRVIKSIIVEECIVLSSVWEMLVIHCLLPSIRQHISRSHLESVVLLWIEWMPSCWYNYFTHIQWCRARLYYLHSLAVFHFFYNNNNCVMTQECLSTNRQSFWLWWLLQFGIKVIWCCTTPQS